MSTRGSARTTSLTAAPASAPEHTLPELPIGRMPGHLIRRLQQMAVAVFARELEGNDVTPVQFAALVAIAHQPCIDQARLAAAIGYDRATIGGVVDRLEAKQWVQRTTDPEDRRARLLVLTSEGRKTLRRIQPGAQRAQDIILGPLSASERRTFEQLTLKLLGHHGF